MIEPHNSALAMSASCDVKPIVGVAVAYPLEVDFFLRLLPTKVGVDVAMWAGERSPLELRWFVSHDDKSL